VEVALSVQYDDRPFSAPALWNAGAVLSDRYAIVREEPALPPFAEEFDFVPSAPFRVEMLGQFPGTRHVFESDDGSRLVQLQPDRFAHNWRRTNADAEYPSFEQLAGEFEDRLRDVLGGRLDELGASWVEVIYVNHVETDPPQAAHQRPQEVLSFLSGIPVPTAEDSFEDLQLQQRFLIRDAGEVCGRLHVNASAQFRNIDAMPLLVLTLVAHVRVRTAGIEAVREALRVGHDRLLQGFTRLTTDQMHETWGYEA
jgi:uncharacterized protein (TIGR04255 family)